MTPKSNFRRFLRHPSGVTGCVILLFFALVAVTVGFVFPQGPWGFAARPMLWPGAQPGLPLGTDTMGRDLLVEVAYGTRVSLMVGLSAAVTASIFGTVVGAISGYFGGIVDDILMRITDAFQTIPSFMAAILIVGLIGPSIYTIVTSIAVVSWPMVARLVRAEFLRLKTYDFILSCRITGMSDWRIMMTQILPNCLSPIVVASSLLVANAIIIEAGLSFLGLGDPNMVSWGGVIGNGKSALRVAWYITMIPAGAVVLTVLALNLVGDALNDVLNPRLRQG